MNHDASNLINGYLDDCLTPEQQQSLRDWLKESPDNAREFASSVMLHDRVRGEMLALTAMAGDSQMEPATTGEASGAISRAESAASKGSAPFYGLLTLLRQSKHDFKTGQFTLPMPGQAGGMSIRNFLCNGKAQACSIRLACRKRLKQTRRHRWVRSRSAIEHSQPGRYRRWS